MLQKNKKYLKLNTSKLMLLIDIYSTLMEIKNPLQFALKRILK